MTKDLRNIEKFSKRIEEIEKNVKELLKDLEELEERDEIEKEKIYLKLKEIEKLKKRLGYINLKWSALFPHLYSWSFIKTTLTYVGKGLGLLLFAAITCYVPPFANLGICPLFIYLGLFVFLFSLIFALPSIFLYYRFLKMNAKMATQITETQKLLEKAEEIAKRMRYK